MTGTPHRRRFDQASPSPSVKAEERLLRFSNEIISACNAFFVSRSLPINLPFAEAYAPERFKARHGDPESNSVESEEDGDATPRGEVKSQEHHNQTPNGPQTFYTGNSE